MYADPLRPTGATPAAQTTAAREQREGRAHVTDLDPTRTVHCHIRQLYADHYAPCRSRYVRLSIHPTVNDLRASADHLERRHGFTPQDHSDAVGLFQPAPFRSRYDRKAKTWVDTTPAYAGTIRLAQGWCSTEVVAHECTHAALHITRLHDWAQPDGEGAASFGDLNGNAEESFAYMLGALINVVEGLVTEAHRRMGIERV